MYVNKHMMSLIANSIPLRRIQKVCRGLWYLAYSTFCSSTTFEGTGEDATSKTLACKYGAVLQKIRLECIEFSVRLQKFRKATYGMVAVLPLRLL